MTERTICCNFEAALEAISKCPVERFKELKEAIYEMIDSGKNCVKVVYEE
jgi:hypothetical protein